MMSSPTLEPPIASTAPAQAWGAAHESELDLLGILLNDPSRYPEVRGIVQADDFAEGPNGLNARLYLTIGETVDRGEEPSERALAQRFTEALKAIGQADLIATMALKASPASRAATVARDVAAFGSQRRLASLARPGLSLSEVNEGLRAEALRTSTALTTTRLRAKPFAWVDPASIPPRQWLYGRHYIRKFLSGTLAPGGFGKSTHELVEAVAMASGRDLLGVKARERLRVWYWNGEDPLEEIQRKVGAICLHYGITEEDVAGWLFLSSGRDPEDNIIVATETREGASIATPVVEQLTLALKEGAIDVLMLDPFVSCHAVSENDNNKIGAVMKALAGVADVTGCAIDLVHHVTKGRSSGNSDVTVGDGRGASAFLDRVRSARVLNRMSSEEAEQLGLDVASGAHLDFFRIEQGKSNLSARSLKAAWRRMVSIDLGNGSDDYPADRVGVPVRWAPDATAEARRPRVRLTAGQKVIMRALVLGIEAGQGGIVPAVPGVPPGTQGMHRAALKDDAVRASYGGQDVLPESIKRMFNRDITAMVAAEVIRADGDFVWPV